MTKREARNLALQFYELRPTGTTPYAAGVMWNKMIQLTADHIPSNIAATFLACCKTGNWIQAPANG